MDVGASYLTPPNEVKAAVQRALANAPLVMRSPEPVVIITGFGASSVDYGVRFWIEDYERDLEVNDQVRTNLWYEFRRAGIEIPWPIQIEYSREEEPTRTGAHVAAAAASLAAIDLFSTLDDEARHTLARDAREDLYAAGEGIVRQGEPGSSMFVVVEGLLRVTIPGPDRREVRADDLAPGASVKAEAQGLGEVPAGTTCRIDRVERDPA